MADLDTDKLDKIARMMGSSHEAEALVALRRLRAMVEEAGVSWADIRMVVGKPAQEPPRAAPPPPPPPKPVASWFQNPKKGSWGLKTPDAMIWVYPDRNNPGRWSTGWFGANNRRKFSPGSFRSSHDAKIWAENTWTHGAAEEEEDDWHDVADDYDPPF